MGMAMAQEKFIYKDCRDGGALVWSVGHCLLTLNLDKNDIN